MSVEAMAKAWAELINEQEATLNASSLYVGRSVTEARHVAVKLGAKLMFASTGLGLVEGDKKCPPYNLTVAQDPNSISPRLESMGARVSDWWDAMNAVKSTAAPIANMVNCSEIDLVLIALPSSYVQLIANDLGGISNAQVSKIRIFTSRPGIEMLPKNLKGSAMPYDERLETSTLPGTRSDFPQRALRHFFEVLGLSNAPTETAREIVCAAMSRLSVAARPSRRRASDSEITNMLKCAWIHHEGSSTRLLRYLRDDALVSCEQSRFRRLWLDIKLQDNVESRV